MTSTLSWLAPTLVLLYAAALVILSLGRRDDGAGSDAARWLLDGRRLTLPAFIATLVTTWYGGILGVGEYSWRFGISTWLVFGVPYYLAAVLFALVLAPRLRRTGAVSIPELLAGAYGRGAAATGALGVLALSLPVAYVLMTATLLEQLVGLPWVAAVLIAAAFSAGYVSLSGFRAVVRTDMLQLGLMYGGFLLLLPAALAAVGGLGALWTALPSGHRAWDGGLGWQAVLVWYFIALQTMVEPAFYQRVFAARSPRTARTGVLLSVAMWAVFDFLTTFSGLAARLLLPELDNPLAAYPALAAEVLPPLLAAVFTLGLFATVMSTLDSYVFLAAATLSHDLLPGGRDEAGERRRSRFGLWLAAALAAAGAMLFDSAVTVWHHVGSVVTSALLLPVAAVHMPRRWRPSSAWATATMIAGATTATGWLVAADASGFPLGLEPMFAALAVAVTIWGAGLVVRRCS